VVIDLEHIELSRLPIEVAVSAIVALLDLQMRPRRAGASSSADQTVNQTTAQ
jgi:hypothetical protein